jgi:hypothetical protein
LPSASALGAKQMVGALAVDPSEAGDVGRVGPFADNAGGPLPARPELLPTALPRPAPAYEKYKCRSRRFRRPTRPPAPQTMGLRLACDSVEPGSRGRGEVKWKGPTRMTRHAGEHLGCLWVGIVVEADMDRSIGREPCPEPAKAGGGPMNRVGFYESDAAVDMCLISSQRPVRRSAAHWRLKRLNTLRSSSLFARVWYPSFRHIVRI